MQKNYWFEKPLIIILVFGIILSSCEQEKKATFPDGIEISDWFSDTTKIDISTLREQYSIADYGAIANNSTLNTVAIQKLIDKISKEDGGVVVVPKGVFKSGALFFKPRTHLHVQEGGKGPWADEDPNNGANTNIIIENNSFGFCHSALTCGSESIHNRNILIRKCKVEDVARLIHLKMRPDTPQKYEYITFENIQGSGRTCVYIRPWTQFFDLKGKETPPPSLCENIIFRDIKMKVKNFAQIGITENDKLKDFTFENIQIEAEDAKFDATVFEGLILKDVFVNGVALQN